MRRQDKARMDKGFIDSVLNEAQEIYVGFNTNAAPYVIALNFVYLNGKIFIHCAPQGQKIDCIKNDARVGFTAATGLEILREKSTTAYRSVCGSGKTHIIEDLEEKRNALDAIALRYKAHCKVPATDKMLEKTAIFCIEIEDISGKQSPV